MKLKVLGQITFAVFFDPTGDVKDGTYPYENRDYICYENDDKENVYFILSTDMDLRDFGPNLAPPHLDRLYTKEQIHRAMTDLLNEYEYEDVVSNVYVIDSDNKATLITDLYPGFFPEDY